ncbi:hypothetical protein K505DRAFT_148750 [Melanomma pulvis-pyrius CBS 109.77]|uniref:Uncharacterized protein n=1 Tax=Melanomma pulvis-pyrius CBS 109.77 TaxID=1314802 RepID=A0A6A6WQC6_9PLEO|nr:hypothetical protein K505DRAFT_148750 [Melanomma pulvis-pyrius CBS 109.77]
MEPESQRASEHSIVDTLPAPSIAAPARTTVPSPTLPSPLGDHHGRHNLPACPSCPPCCLERRPKSGDQFTTSPSRHPITPIRPPDTDGRLPSTRSIALLPPAVSAAELLTIPPLTMPRLISQGDRLDPSANLHDAQLDSSSYTSNWMAAVRQRCGPLVAAFGPTTSGSSQSSASR